MHGENEIRLDKALVSRKLVSSRARAQTLIKEGKVTVDGNVVTEPDFDIRDIHELKLLNSDIVWVSRAGLKLDHVFTRYEIDLKGKVVLDIGASAGGFTDVVLTRGAAKVYALDVGHGQLVAKIKNDKRVVNMEGTHIKDVSKTDFKEKIDMIVVDVSFISLEKVLPKVKELLRKNGHLIALIKPQFEVGKDKIGKGIVTDPKLHASVAMRIESYTAELGFHIIGVLASPILGGDGNKEFLIYAQFGPAPTV